jgi:hypothetical protein
MRCDCERRGHSRSRVRGILAFPADRHGALVIERCDACERFYSDEAASIYYSTRKGGTLRYGPHARSIIWKPC